MFNPFLLLQSGIVLLISSIFGLRISTSESPVIMAFYLALLVPLAITLFGESVSKLAGDSTTGYYHTRGCFASPFAAPLPMSRF